MLSLLHFLFVSIVFIVFVDSINVFGAGLFRNDDISHLSVPSDFIRRFDVTFLFEEGGGFLLKWEFFDFGAGTSEGKLELLIDSFHIRIDTFFAALRDDSTTVILILSNWKEYSFLVNKIFAYDLPLICWQVLGRYL